MMETNWMMQNAANSPLVSVIIPSYNRVEMLAEAIHSVLSQDYRNFELIVVDDGSTDGTRELLRRYPRLRSIEIKHSGVSTARNVGIAGAKGPLISFLDSDDLWFEGKLSSQVAFFEIHPDAVICQTEEIWIRNGIRINPGKRHKKVSGFFFERSVDLCLVSPSAVMMRKVLFDEVGVFDESMVACEDYDLWLRVSCRHPIYLIDTPFVIKRGGHPDQLSKQSGLDRLRIYALQKTIETPPPGGLTKSQRSAAIQALRKKCLIYAQGCQKRNRQKEAEAYFRLHERYGDGFSQ